MRWYSRMCVHLDFCSFPGGRYYIGVDYFIEEVCDDFYGVGGKAFYVDWGDVVWLESFGWFVAFIAVRTAISIIENF